MELHDSCFACSQMTQMFTDLFVWLLIDKMEYELFVLKIFFCVLFAHRWRRYSQIYYWAICIFLLSTEIFKKQTL